MAARAAAAAAAPALEFTLRYSKVGTVYARKRTGTADSQGKPIVAFCLISIIPDYKYLSFSIDAIIKELYLSLRKYQISDKLGL